jgi:hypothetical protein
MGRVQLGACENVRADGKTQRYGVGGDRMGRDWENIVVIQKLSSMALVEHVRRVPHSGRLRSPCPNSITCISIRCFVLPQAHASQATSHVFSLDSADVVTESFKDPVLTDDASFG